MDQVGDAMREHPGLARSGSRDHEQRPVLVHHRIELIRVQPLGERRRTATAPTERAGVLVVGVHLTGRVRVGAIGGMRDVGEEFVVGHGDVHSTDGL